MPSNNTPRGGNGAGGHFSGGPTTMTPERPDTIDVLSALLQAEQAGLFHFMAEAGPYINRAAAELHRPLREMVSAGMRREAELTGLLGEMGSTPKPVPVRMEHQYLAFLSVDFLVPKLIEAKQRSIAQYERATVLVGGADPSLMETFERHLRELRNELAVLNACVKGVAKTGRAGSQRPSQAFEPEERN